MPNLELSIDGRIATLTLNRPEKMNALSPALLDELLSACESLSADESVRVVVVRGSGAHFSAGADLPGFNERFAADEDEAADLGRRATEALWRLPQITIAGVTGHCVGGALVLLACCDLRIASVSAVFSIPEIDAGIPLAWGGMAHLNRLIGETRATDLVLSCRPFGAAEAHAAGLLTTVVDEQALDIKVGQTARDIAAKAGYAVRATKRQLTALRDGSFDPRADADALRDARRDEEAGAIGKAYIERIMGKSHDRS